MEQKTFRIQQLAHANGLNLPTYSTIGSAGMDLTAAINDPITINPQTVALIPTGIIIEVQDGYEAQVRPRSGLAIKNGITILNSPGTIDSDYRGEVKVIMINHSNKDFIVNRGDRIAQLIISPFQKINWENVDSLTETKRGDGGFGHTGI
ncbi:MAG: dUTP diphosphatase [Bacteroidetes bacterium]|nr:dUTP diphosphatase [Bacteroidota bacterium]